VTTERQGIVIEPANPELIYPPVYSPAGVYGPWPYPDYPPFDIYPPEPDFGLSAPFGIGFGVGFVVVRPLSRWCAFDWHQRQIRLDVDRFNALNRHMPGIETSTWQHDPSRFGVHSRDFRLARAVPGVPRVRHLSGDGSPSQHAERCGFCADSHAALGIVRFSTSRASAHGHTALGTAIIRTRWARAAGSN
jgi:hypothetical protein